MIIPLFHRTHLERRFQWVRESKTLRFQKEEVFIRSGRCGISCFDFEISSCLVIILRSNIPTSPVTHFVPPHLIPVLVMHTGPHLVGHTHIIIIFQFVGLSPHVATTTFSLHPYSDGMYSNTLSLAMSRLTHTLVRLYPSYAISLAPESPLCTS